MRAFMVSPDAVSILRILTDNPLRERARTTAASPRTPLARSFGLSLCRACNGVAWAAPHRLPVIRRASQTLVFRGTSIRLGLQSLLQEHKTALSSAAFAARSELFVI